jgi:hypothetical protein
MRRGPGDGVAPILTERFLVGVHVVLDGHRRPVANDLDEVVGSGEDPVLVVDGNIAEVLDKVRWESLCLQALCERGDLERFIPHRDAEGLRDRVSDLVVVHLDRTVERVDLAVVRFRIFQDGGDDVGLVLTGDRRVATISERKSQNTLVATVIPIPVQPFGEERRPQMGRLHRGTVQQAFANPVLAGGVAIRLTAGGDLGHIDHSLETGFTGCLGENGDGVEQPGSDRVAEIHSRDPSQRRAECMEVEKIANNDLGSVRSQALGTRVAAVDKGSDTVPTLKQKTHRGNTGVPGRSCD